MHEPRDQTSIDTIEPLTSPRGNQVSSPPSDKQTGLPTDEILQGEVNLEQQLDLSVTFYEMLFEVVHWVFLSNRDFRQDLQNIDLICGHET
jgi:hypothetical protein